MARVVAVFGPPRWVGRDVAVQRRFTPDDVFVIIAPRHGPPPASCAMRLAAGFSARTMAPNEPGMTLVGVAPRHRR
jgi:hypothetical protein